MSSPFDSASQRPQSDQIPIPDSDMTLAAEPNPKLESTQAGLSSDWSYAYLAPQAIRYAMSIVRKWADAEEIVQESFCRLLQLPPPQPNGPDSPRQSATRVTPGNPKAQLFTIVRNLAIDQLRTNRRRNFEPIESVQIANKEDTTDESRLNRLETEIQRALNQMPKQWADALRLRINGELSYAEISDVLNATHAQVRTWIFRARKQLESDLVQNGLLEGGNRNESF